jgi:hypothetical protein
MTVLQHYVAWNGGGWTPPRHQAAYSWTPSSGTLSLDVVSYIPSEVHTRSPPNNIVLHTNQHTHTQGHKHLWWNTRQAQHQLNKEANLVTQTCWWVWVVGVRLSLLIYYAQVMRWPLCPPRIYVNLMSEVTNNNHILACVPFPISEVIMYCFINTHFYVSSINCSYAVIKKGVYSIN